MGFTDPLSGTLKDYLYIPLGGSRQGKSRRYANLMITMLLGGLWHGAGWTFVLWGALHGFYLIINHGWRVIFKNKRKTKFGALFAWTLTFIALIVSWVPFRAESLEGAGNILAGMFGLNGFVLPESYLGHLNHLAGLGNYLLAIGWEFGDAGLFKGVKEVAGLLFLLLISVAFPNTQQIMRRYRPAFETYKGEIPRLRWRVLEWRPTRIWALFSSTIFVLAVLGLTRVSEFLYFQF